MLENILPNSYIVVDAVECWLLVPQKLLSSADYIHKEEPIRMLKVADMVYGIAIGFFSERDRVCYDAELIANNVIPKKTIGELGEPALDGYLIFDEVPRLYVKLNEEITKHIDLG